MARVTGIGGVFFKSTGNAARLAAWYQAHLGLPLESFGGGVLNAILVRLRADGVKVVGGPESHENGKFAWIMDPDGNKVELWEPMIWDEKAGYRDNPSPTPLRTANSPPGLYTCSTSASRAWLAPQ